MTLPPTQNQYPGWEPPKQNAPQSINDFGAGLSDSDNSSNSSIPPVQNIQSGQIQAPQTQPSTTNNNFAFQSQPAQSQPQAQIFDNSQTNQPASQPNTGDLKSKKTFKGPLLLLISVIVVFGVITGFVLLTSKKPANNAKLSNTNSAAKSQTTQAPTKPEGNSSPAQTEQTTSDDSKTADTSNQPYEFTDDQQMSNLKNLQTSLTTYQSQNNKKQLPTATPQGWALLKANNVIDPVTNKPYAFAVSNNPNVGEVQYAAQSVCSSDNTVIASTDLSSFALRTRLYNGTYYCVDSSNARS